MLMLFVDLAGLSWSTRVAQRRAFPAPAAQGRHHARRMLEHSAAQVLRRGGGHGAFRGDAQDASYRCRMCGPRVSNGRDRRRDGRRSAAADRAEADRSTCGASSGLAPPSMPMEDRCRSVHLQRDVAQTGSERRCVRKSASASTLAGRARAEGVTK